MLTNRTHQSTFIKKRVNKLRTSFLYNPEHNCLLCNCRINIKSNIPYICSYCLASLPQPTNPCRYCGAPTIKKGVICGKCQLQRPTVDRTFTAILYKEQHKQLIWKIKKHFDVKMTELLVSLLFKNFSSNKEYLDAIVYPPTYWKKNLSNAGNHSRLIASAFSKKAQIPLIHDMFFQKAPNTEQKRLPATERQIQRKNLYRVKKDCRSLSIGIIDDIITTGATTNELARILKKHGATRVYALALARTPLKR